MRLGIAAIFACSGTALVFACSGSSNPDTDGGDASTDVALAPEGAAPPDGASIDAAPPDERIDPLALGRSWIYEVETREGGAPCTAGVQVSEVLGPGNTYDGSASLRYKPLCTVTVADAIIEGDRFIGYVVDASPAVPLLVLDSPVEEGHAWAYSPGGQPTLVWHDAGTVTVPAGTFTDCWNRDNVNASPGHFTYCRGVGLAAVDDPTYKATLTSKNF